MTLLRSGSQPRASHSPSCCSMCWRRSDVGRRCDRPRVVALRARVPRVRAVSWGAVLNGRSGAEPDRLLLRRPDRPRLPARALHGADLHGGRHRRQDRARCVSAAPSRCQQGAGLEELRRHRARLQRSLLGAALSDPARSGTPVPEPGSREGRPGAPVAEHGRQLHHEHQLAVLRRRVHDVVPDADGRPRGAELCLRGGRHGGPCRGRPRDRAPLVGHARQLLGRPLPVARLHPAAARCDRHRAPRLAGRPADAERARDRAHAPGRDADGCPRPGRLADRDQAARDERRRVLQLELGRPVREPDRSLELHRAAGDPADPGGAGLHVRADGSCAAARLGGVRVDVRRVPARDRDQPARRAARKRGPPQLRA